MTNWLSDLDWSSMYNTWLISNVNPHPVLNPRFVVNREFIVNPQFVVNGEFIIIPQFFVNPQFDVNGEFQPLIHRQSRIHRQRRIYRQTWICPQFSIHRESPIHQFVVNQRTSPNGCLSWDWRRIGNWRWFLTSATTELNIKDLNLLSLYLCVPHGWPVMTLWMNILWCHRTTYLVLMYNVILDILIIELGDILVVALVIMSCSIFVVASSSLR